MKTPESVPGPYNTDDVIWFPYDAVKRARNVANNLKGSTPITDSQEHVAEVTDLIEYRQKGEQQARQKRITEIWKIFLNLKPNP